MEYSLRNGKGGKGKSIKEISLLDGTIIGIFPGSRGANPDHDIIIKYQERNKRVRTPKHIHWVIDLLIKKEHNRELTLEFLNYLRDMYDKVNAFSSKEDRAKCILTETTNEKLKPFEKLNKYGEYKVDFIGNLIELMIKMEKNTPPEKPARVFRELMDSIIQEMSEKGFVFRLDFIIYCLLGIIHNLGSDMTKLHGNENKENLEKAWKDLDSWVLDYALNLMKSQAYVDHSHEINSVYALVPIIVYISHKGKDSLTQSEIKKIVKWFYYSQVRQRYIS